MLATKCRVPSCDSRATSAGACRLHYLQARHQKNLNDERGLIADVPTHDEFDLDVDEAMDAIEAYNEIGEG